MPDLAEQPHLHPPAGRSGARPAVAPERHSERAARRSLLAQIRTLETELGSLFVSSWPRRGLEFSVPGRGGPRLLALEELEELRDALVTEVAAARDRLAERTRLEERHRRRIEEMLLEPEKHKWVRITSADIGEPGCRSWHVRPRWGLLGMLMNWWRVRISSGCPLPAGCGGRH